VHRQQHKIIKLNFLLGFIDYSISMSHGFFDQRLSSLKAELKSYGFEIVEYVTSLYQINAPGCNFDFKNDPFNMLTVLQADVTELLKECDQRQEYKEIHKSEMDECCRLAELLTQISSIMDKITECESLISRLDLLPACDMIELINLALGKLPNDGTEIGCGKVSIILKKESKLLSCRLSAKLIRILKESIQFDFGRIVLHRELKGMLRSEDTIINDPISLKSVWTALHHMSKSDEAVDELLQCLWKYILHPLWKEKKTNYPVRCELSEESGLTPALGPGTSSGSGGTAQLVLEGVAKQWREGKPPPSIATVPATTSGNNQFSHIFLCCNLGR
jgi:hypothetical protein